MPYEEQLQNLDYNNSESKSENPSLTNKRKFKSKNVKEFLKTIKGQKLLNLAKKLGLTIRGVTELVFLIWTLFDDDGELTSTVVNLLKQLKGVDGLKAVLSVLKLVPDRFKKK